MKKTYISPEILLVELRCKANILQMSLQANGTRTITTEGDGGWVKEENSPISDKSLWDSEW